MVKASIVHQSYNRSTFQL